MSGKPTEAKVQTVTDTLALSDGSETLELHALLNSHSQGMLVAYLPKQKLLYNADLFSPLLVGPLPLANDFAVELRDGIRKLNLQWKPTPARTAGWRPPGIWRHPSGYARSSAAADQSRTPFPQSPHLGSFADESRRRGKGSRENAACVARLRGFRDARRVG